ncbi:MAG: HesA/MoeB/ThiF family protein [Bacteroidetes bacterium]|nr:HesA/MoeB/ThiF family protein [Bacteroidota bacterium]
MEMEEDFLVRYQRQLSLSEVGLSGQRALRAARILIVGMGGLGCPALQYLSAAGVGTLVLVDDDEVSLSNLHRQTLYSPQQIGQKKVQVAADWVSSLNKEIQVVAVAEKFSAVNALNLLQYVDLVVDCTDTFTARYAINDACAEAGIPWVYGSIAKFEGQVSIFNVPNEEWHQGNKRGLSHSLNYRDVFPNPPADGEVQNCTESGVLGALAGIVGSLQALEALKFLLKTEGLLVDQMLTYDGLLHRMLKYQLRSSNPSKS